MSKMYRTNLKDVPKVEGLKREMALRAALKWPISVQPPKVLRKRPEIPFRPDSISKIELVPPVPSLHDHVPVIAPRRPACV